MSLFFPLIIFPTVALVCHKVNHKYVSWTYDSPFMFLYSTTIALKTNLAFIFDKATVDELRKKGIETVHYLPMAAPVAYYDSLYSSSNVRKKYQSEISFVGSLYTEDRQDQMKRLKGITQETDKYLEMLIGLQLQSYAMPILRNF